MGKRAAESQLTPEDLEDEESRPRLRAAAKGPKRPAPLGGAQESVFKPPEVKTTDGLFAGISTGPPAPSPETKPAAAPTASPAKQPAAQAFAPPAAQTPFAAARAGGGSSGSGSGSGEALFKSMKPIPLQTRFAKPDDAAAPPAAAAAAAAASGTSAGGGLPGVSFTAPASEGRQFAPPPAAAVSGPASCGGFGAALKGFAADAAGGKDGGENAMQRLAAKGGVDGPAEGRYTPVAEPASSSAAQQPALAERNEKGSSFDDLYETEVHHPVVQFKVFDGEEWTDRGSGPLKAVLEKKSGKAHIMIWQQGTMSMLVSVQVGLTMQLPPKQPPKENMMTFVCVNSKTNKVETCLVRVGKDGSLKDLRAFATRHAAPQVKEAGGAEEKQEEKGSKAP